MVARTNPTMLFVDDGPKEPNARKVNVGNAADAIYGFRNKPRLANGPVSVRFDGTTLRVVDASGCLLELHDCRQIAVQLPQFPLELFEIEEKTPS